MNKISLGLVLIAAFVWLLAHVTPEKGISNSEYNKLIENQDDIFQKQKAIEYRLEEIADELNI